MKRIDDLLNAIAKRITPRRKRFVDEWLDNGMNGQKAALKTYEIGSNGGGKDEKSMKNTAAALASQVLKDEDVQAYIKLQAYSAAERVTELAVIARSETVRLQANKDILDRAGFKPQDKIDVTSRGDKLYTNEQIERAAAEIISGKHGIGPDQNDGTSGQGETVGVQPDDQPEV